MNLSTNENIYLDANFLIAYFVDNHNDHKNSKKLFALLLINKNSFHFTPLTVDELMMGVHEVKNKAEIKKGSKKGYSVAHFYPELKDALEYLLNNKQFRLRQFENNLTDSCLLALENLKKFNLRPRDSFHVSYMQDFDIKYIVSTDKN